MTRTAASITRDAFLEERARDVEDLCDALVMLAAADKRAELPTKAILVGDALSVFDLLISARAHPVGVALTDRGGGPRTRTLLRLFDVPAIVGVEGLFRWASDGDVALVDADHGLLVINPSQGRGRGPARVQTRAGRARLKRQPSSAGSGVSMERCS